MYAVIYFFLFFFKKNKLKSHLKQILKLASALTVAKWMFYNRWSTQSSKWVTNEFVLFIRHCSHKHTHAITQNIYTCRLHWQLSSCKTWTYLTHFFPHYRHREYKCFTFNTGQPSKNTVLSSESIFTWTESYCSCIPQCIAPYNAGNSIAYRNKIWLRIEYVNIVPKWSASQKITVRHRLSECLMYSQTQPEGAGGPRSIRGQQSTERLWDWTRRNVIRAKWARLLSPEG